MPIDASGLRASQVSNFFREHGFVGGREGLDRI